MSSHSLSPLHTWRPSKDIFYLHTAVSFYDGPHVSLFLTQHISFFIWEYMPSVSSAHSSWACVCLCVFSDKVNDPVMAVQIAWMMEVPQLYRQCYDKPFQLQPGATGYKHHSLNAITVHCNTVASFASGLLRFFWLNFQKKKRNVNQCFHQVLLWNMQFVHQDKQQVVLILQSDASRLL